jgi:hypothetical protein
MKIARVFFIYGGLGNQIFQINMALTRKLDFGEDVIIDLGLNKGKVSDVVDVNRIIQLGIDVVYNPIRSKIVLIFSKVSFGRYFFSISTDNDKCLRRFNLGYWQNSFGFKKHYVEKVLSISFNPPIPNKLLLHLRVGDYVIGKNLNIYNKLDINYYLDGLNFILKNKKLDSIIIFSNNYFKAVEFQEAILLFCLEYGQQIDVIVDDSQNDLDLFIRMLECDNFLIANSSLSLAASLLSPGYDSLKIGPKKWFVKTIFPYSILTKEYVQF